MLQITKKSLLFVLRTNEREP